MVYKRDEGKIRMSNGTSHSEQDFTQRKQCNEVAL